MQTVHQQNVLVRSPYFPAIHWGAIFAGIIAGLAMQFTLALLGLASGLSALDVNETGNPGPTPWIAGVWQGFSMLLAAFLGGYIAARMSGLHRKSDGVLHGFVAWGATLLLFATLTTSIAGPMFGNLFGNIQHMSMSETPMSMPADNDLAVNKLRALIAERGGIDDASAIDVESLRVLQRYIEAGNREGAMSYMVGTMGFDPERARLLVDQALIVSGQPQSASPKARERAQQTVSMLSAATWTVFAAVALSLCLGVLGGLFGAKASRRTVRMAV